MTKMKFIGLTPAELSFLLAIGSEVMLSKVLDDVEKSEEQGFVTLAFETRKEFGLVHLIGIFLELGGNLRDLGRKTLLNLKDFLILSTSSPEEVSKMLSPVVPDKEALKNVIEVELSSEESKSAVNAFLILALSVIMTEPEFSEDIVKIKLPLAPVKLAASSLQGVDLDRVFKEVANAGLLLASSYEAKGDEAVS